VGKGSLCWADGLLFLPYLNTAGAPRWNAEARAAFIGIAQNHGRAHMARAVMEGVALEAQDNIRHLQGHGLAVEMIRAGGGATRSALWTQIQADIYGRPVGLLREAETTALGAAILGAVGAGHFADIDEGAAAMVDVVEVVEPHRENVERYEALYEAYVAAYEALSPRVFPGLGTLPE
jgi:xylulokinase